MHACGLVNYHCRRFFFHFDCWALIQLQWKIVIPHLIGARCSIVHLVDFIRHIHLISSCWWWRLQTVWLNVTLSTQFTISGCVSVKQSQCHIACCPYMHYHWVDLLEQWQIFPISAIFNNCYFFGYNLMDNGCSFYRVSEYTWFP